VSAWGEALDDKPIAKALGEVQRRGGLLINKGNGPAQEKGRKEATEVNSMNAKIKKT